MADLRAIKGAYDEGSGLPPPRAFGSFNTHAREVMACGSWTQCLKHLRLGLLADRWVGLLADRWVGMQQPCAVRVDRLACRQMHMVGSLASEGKKGAQGACLLDAVPRATLSWPAGRQVGADWVCGSGYFERWALQTAEPAAFLRTGGQV